MPIRIVRTVEATALAATEPGQPEKAIARVRADQEAVHVTVAGFEEAVRLSRAEASAVGQLLSEALRPAQSEDAPTTAPQE